MRILITVLLLSLPRAAAAAGQAPADCSKSSDACYAGRKLSPFMEAVRAVEAAETKPAAPAPVKAARRTKAPAPAPEPQASTAAVPAPAAGPEAAGGFSHPAWLVFIAGALAGLYFYLRAPARRRGSRR